MRNNNNIPIRRVNTCAYCGPGKVHIIDPSLYSNDVVAKKTKRGDWMCGNCVEREIEDVILRSSPNSARAKEIREERKRKEAHEQFLKRIDTQLRNVRVTGGRD